PTSPLGGRYRLATKPPYRSTTARATNAAVSAAPSPASALPSAATATPATINALPTGRRRKVAAATHTTASVPSVFATTATSRAGTNARWSCAAGIPLAANGPCSGTETATPTASPVYASTSGAAQRRPQISSEPAPSSGAVSSPPNR